MLTRRTKDYLLLAAFGAAMMEEPTYEKQEVSENKVTDRLKIQRGHRVFKMINGEISELDESEYQESLVELPRLTSLGDQYTVGRKVRKLTPEEGALYVSALNMKNAIKKFKKLGAVEASQ